MLVANALHDCWKLPTVLFELSSTVTSMAAAAVEAHWLGSVVPTIVQSTVSAPVVVVATGSGAPTIPGAARSPLRSRRPRDME